MHTIKKILVPGCADHIYIAVGERCYRNYFSYVFFHTRMF